jgi:hypothetical protein
MLTSNSSRWVWIQFPWLALRYGGTIGRHAMQQRQRAAVANSGAGRPQPAGRLSVSALTDDSNEENTDVVEANSTV